MIACLLFSYRVRAVLLLVGVLTAAMLAGCSQTPASFMGTELTAKEPAPGFTLVDQFGEEISLSDKRGNVVALTFLYTNCPDICPLTAHSLGKAHEALGEDTARVSIIAISVDPDRDTPQQARAYSQQRNMLDKWSFLTGPEEELSLLWEAFYVAVDRTDDSGGAIESLGTDLAREALASSEGLSEKAAYLVTHSAPVYLIDQQGTMRSIITDLTLDPEPLVHDIRLLLK